MESSLQAICLSDKEEERNGTAHAAHNCRSTVSLPPLSPLPSTPVAVPSPCVPSSLPPLLPPSPPPVLGREELPSFPPSLHLLHPTAAKIRVSH